MKFHEHGIIYQNKFSNYSVQDFKTYAEMKYFILLMFVGHPLLPFNSIHIERKANFYRVRTVICK